MIKRYFRRTSSGEWLQDVFGAERAFTVTAAQQIADLAAAHGISGSDIAARDVTDGSDPRTGVLLVPAPPPVRVLSADRQRVEAILSTPKSTRTADDLSDAIDIILRRFREQL